MRGKVHGVILGVVLLATCKEATGPRGDLVFKQVSAGYHHACGVTTAGTAYCWGYGATGQLGVGAADTIPHPTPVAVAGGLTFASVSAGFATTCGVTISGAAYCWGYNGQQPNSLTPIAVADSLTFALVSTGGYLSCGLTASAVAYCWASYGGSVAPTPVGSQLTFVTVAAGHNHACGVAVDGTAYCWGYNSQGQLGVGSESIITSQTPLAVAGGLSFARVSARAEHTSALTTAGAAYWWGDMDYGASGSTSPPMSWSPVAVAGGLTFAALSSGSFHTCGLTTGRVAYCWGYNAYGALGNGSLTYSNVPMLVAGGLTFSEVSGGENFTCGLTTNGVLYCWGDNYSGQLGDGTTTTRLAPVRVVGQRADTATGR